MNNLIYSELPKLHVVNTSNLNQHFGGVKGVQCTAPASDVPPFAREMRWKYDRAMKKQGEDAVCISNMSAYKMNPRNAIVRLEKTQLARFVVQQPPILRSFQAPSIASFECPRSSRRNFFQLVITTSALALLSSPSHASIPIDPDFSGSQRARAAAQLGGDYLNSIFVGRSNLFSP